MTWKTREQTEFRKCYCDKDILVSLPRYFRLRSPPAWWLRLLSLNFQSLCAERAPDNSLLIRFFRIPASKPWRPNLPYRSGDVGNELANEKTERSSLPSFFSDEIILSPAKDATGRAPGASAWANIRWTGASCWATRRRCVRVWQVHRTCVSLCIESVLSLWRYAVKRSGVVDLTIGRRICLPVCVMLNL